MSDDKKKKDEADKVPERYTEADGSVVEKIGDLTCTFDEDPEKWLVMRSAVNAAKKSGVIILTPDNEFSGVTFNTDQYVTLLRALMLVFHGVNCTDLSEAQKAYKSALIILDSINAYSVRDMARAYHEGKLNDVIKTAMNELDFPEEANSIIHHTKGGLQ